MSSISDKLVSMNCGAAGELGFALRGSLHKVSLSSDTTDTKDCLVALKEASLPLTGHCIKELKL